MHLRSWSIMKSPIPSTGLKKLLKLWRLCFSEAERTACSGGEQARATMRASAADPPPPCAWTPSLVRGSALSPVAVCIHYRYLFSLHRHKATTAIGILIPEREFEITAGWSCGRSITEMKQVLKRPTPFFMEQECSSADATFFHISCEWHHPNATWEASVTFLIPPAQPFNPTNHSPEAVDLTSESFYDSFLCLSVRPTSHPSCLSISRVRPVMHMQQAQASECHGLPFWNRTGPIVTESSQLRLQGLQPAALAWRRHSRKEGHVLSSGLEDQKFPKLFSNI